MGKGSSGSSGDAAQGSRDIAEIAKKNLADWNPIRQVIMRELGGTLGGPTFGNTFPVSPGTGPPTPTPVSPGMGPPTPTIDPTSGVVIDPTTGGTTGGQITTTPPAPTASELGLTTPGGAYRSIFAPAREAIGDAYTTGREGLLQTAPSRGGQLNAQLLNLGLSQARSTSALEADIMNRAFTLGTGFATEAPAQALQGLGQSAQLQAGLGAQGFNQNFQTAAGVGLLGALAGPPLAGAAKSGLAGIKGPAAISETSSAPAASAVLLA